MFISALFIIAKIWKEHMFIDRCMNKESIECLLNGILFRHKKNENLIYAATWMNFEKHFAK